MRARINSAECRATLSAFTRTALGCSDKPARPEYLRDVCLQAALLPLDLVGTLNGKNMYKTISLFKNLLS